MRAHGDPVAMEIDGANSGAGDQREPAEVVRLRPLSVLIVSGDHRFRAVMEMLLARRGCSASSVSATQSICDLLADRRVDVVLVDGLSALRELSREISEDDARSLPVGVVMVCEPQEPIPTGLRWLTKWGDFDELYAAVFDADRARTRPPSSAQATGPREICSREPG